MEQLIITPKTKIYDLLEAYPQLEDVLISAAPQFKKLKNPILRKTIAKVTSLAQAAVVGGLKVEALIIQLRQVVGQDVTEHFAGDTVHYVSEKPAWYSADRVVETIDIREMLNAGEHPVHEVLAQVKKLDDQGILKVIAPFAPAPLIDKATSLSVKHWLHKQTEEEFWLYFKK